MDENDVVKNKKVGRTTENTLSCLFAFCVLFNGLNSCIIQIHGGLGHYIIYIASIIPILIGITTFIYIVVLLKNSKQLKAVKKYFIIGILLLFLCGCNLFIGSGYMKDVISGTQTVSTDYFLIRKTWIRLYIDENEDTTLYLNDSQYEYLIENESDLDEKKVLKLSDNISINGHAQGFAVEYYPNSCVIKSILIVE